MANFNPQDSHIIR